MTAPTLSIIINNFNYARFLSAAIESVLTQIEAGVELIVVDDGSTDHSREVIASFGNRLTPILKSNGGVASAFNIGFARSRGAWVWFLDADDYLLPGAIAAVRAAMKPESALIYGRLRKVGPHGKVLGIIPELPAPLPQGTVWKQFLRTGDVFLPATSANIFNRAFLDRVLPMPEEKYRRSGDTYLRRKLPFLGPVIGLGQVLGVYRVHGQNVSLVSNCDPAGMIARIEWEMASYALLTAEAEAQGASCARDLAAINFPHARRRLSSLVANGGRHPVPDDTRFGLLAKAARACFHYRPGRWRENVLSVCKLAAVAFAPGDFWRRHLDREKHRIVGGMATA